MERKSIENNSSRSEVATLPVPVELGLCTYPLCYDHIFIRNTFSQPNGRNPGRHPPTNDESDMKTTYAKALPILTVLALLSAACGDRAPLQPMARLAAGASEVELSFAQNASLQLTWSPLASREDLGPNPIVFVHLLDTEGDVLRTFDHSLDLSGWRVGEDLSYDLELFQSFLTEPLDPGRYPLTVGLYELGGEPYGLVSDSPDVGGQEFQVAEVVVPEGVPPLAHIGFLGDWQALEPSGDSQVLVRRWLGNGGRLTFDEVTVPLDLHLQLNLMDEIPDSTLEGSGAVHLQAINSCGEGAELFIAGVHRIDLRLDPPEDNSRCWVELEAASVWTSSDGIVRSVLLEMVTLNEAEDAAEGAE